MLAQCSPSDSCPALCRCRASPPTSTGVPTSTRRSCTNGYAKRSGNFVLGCDIRPTTTVPGMHADVHERGSSEYPDAPLLTYLQTRLQRAELAYLRPPVPIAGALDTRIYALQLLHVPQLLAGARLYALYPLPILRALEWAGVPSSLASTEDVLVRLLARTPVRGLEGLLPGCAWPLPVGLALVILEWLCGAI